jgi:cytosine/adenosine deaminase-related metal-dependent hydrolase
VLKAATLIDFEPVCVERGDLRIANGKIIARGQLTPEPGDDVIDLSGRLLLPGLVSAHHRLCGTAIRGLKRRGTGFAAEAAALSALEAILSLDDIGTLAAAGGLEGLFSGTTTVFNTQASAQPLGTLNATAHGLNGVGLRAVLACEINDVHGEAAREEAIAECEAYAERARGRFRAAFAIGSLGSLSDAALSGVGAVRARLLAAPLLLSTLAHDPLEEQRSVTAFGKTPVERLLEAGLVSTSSVLAHNVHLSWPQLSELINLGPWMVHAARANMASQSGLATPSKFGVRACLGTDVMALDVLTEAQIATLRSIEVGQPLNILRLLANGHRLASAAFDATIGPLREGALADLLVCDYTPPAPLDASNLGEHLLLGLSSRDVESVMVDGLWRLWKRKPLAIDVGEVGRSARERTAALWQRLSAGGSGA